MGQGRALFGGILACALVAIACAPAATPAPADDGTMPLAGGRGDVAAAAPDAPEVTFAPRAEPRSRAIAPTAAFPYTAQPEWIPTLVDHDAGRYGARVQYVVIHYTAISYERTLRAFNNPNSGVSAHYVVRADGHIAQLVGEADTAWHAGNYWYNQRSIGIELEIDAGTNPNFTPQQYYAAASLACAIAGRHGIPLDRAHVVGHNEIPGTDHTDPGPTWGWPHFMWLTSLCAPPTAATVHAGWVSQTDFPDVTVGHSQSVSVVLKNTGATAWRKGTSQEARLAVRGNDETFAGLGDGWPTPSRPAVQKEDLVQPGQNATFTFRVKGTAPGTHTIPLRGVVDGGAWMDDLGIYTKVTVRAKEKPKTAR